MLYIKDKNFFERWGDKPRPDGWESHTYPAYIEYSYSTNTWTFETMSTEEVEKCRFNQLVAWIDSLDTSIENLERKRKEALTELIKFLNGEG